MCETPSRHGSAWGSRAAGPRRSLLPKLAQAGDVRGEPPPGWATRPGGWGHLGLRVCAGVPRRYLGTLCRPGTRGVTRRKLLRATGGALGRGRGDGRAEPRNGWRSAPCSRRGGGGGGGGGQRRPAGGARAINPPRGGRRVAVGARRRRRKERGSAAGKGRSLYLPTHLPIHPPLTPADLAAPSHPCITPLLFFFLTNKSLSPPRLPSRALLAAGGGAGGSERGGGCGLAGGSSRGGARSRTPAPLGCGMLLPRSRLPGRSGLDWKTCVKRRHILFLRKLTTGACCLCLPALPAPCWNWSGGQS